MSTFLRLLSTKVEHFQLSTFCYGWVSVNVRLYLVMSIGIHCKRGKDILVISTFGIVAC